jgi:endoribonuclease Dicer
MEYYPRWEDERPRILGMTASPVDTSKADVRIAAMDLEEILCGKIATISDEAMGGFRDNRDETERTECYEKLEDPEHSKTNLWEAISRCIGRNPQFKAHLSFTRDASSVLGTWCADRYWQLLTTNDEMATIEAKTGRDTLDLDVFDSDEAIAAVSRTRDIIQDHQFGPIANNWSDLSSKVKTLHGILDNAFSQRLSKRCIVFVEQRTTAFLLADLFSQPEMSIPGMRTSYMVSFSDSFAFWLVLIYLAFLDWFQHHLGGGKYVPQRPDRVSSKVQTRRIQLSFCHFCSGGGNRRTRMRRYRPI